MDIAIPFEHGGNIYKAVRQKNNTRFIDYSANINPLGLASNVRAAIVSSIEDIIHYPDPDAHDLKIALSKFYQIDAAGLTLGNGAVELLYVLCHVIKPQRALVFAPSFSEYERAARACGANVEYGYLDESKDYTINLAEIIPQLKKIDIVFIGNPNNPTGTLTTNRQLEPFIAAAKQENCLVVIDESFIDFLPEDQHYSCRQFVHHYSNLIILHSLTKFYAIPGLRLGFTLSSPYIANLLHAAKDPWNVNTLAQIAGVAALSSLDYQAKTKEVVQLAKERFFADLCAIKNIKCYQPTVNFILLNLEKAGMTAAELKYLLFNKGILIRDCSNYPGLSPYDIRLAVKLPEQNSIILAALKELLKDGKSS